MPLCLVSCWRARSKRYSNNCATITRQVSGSYQTVFAIVDMPSQPKPKLLHYVCLCRLVGGSALAGHTGADSPAQSTPSVELPVHFLDASRQPNASDEVHSPPNASSQQQASLFRRSAEQQAVTQDAKGAAGNEFPAGGSPPQSPSAPPGPAQADNGTRSYPPGTQLLFAMMSLCIYPRFTCNTTSMIWWHHLKSVAPTRAL